MTHHQPYHLMNPHPGISPAHETATGYCHASPSGDGRVAGNRLSYQALAPNGAVDIHEAQTATAPYSSFYIHHSSLFFTFSAKEKDSETGLSYFGSRYYNSDLSIWLSVDPMSGKYPSLSPYVYCADNPVRCADPDGEEIVISTSMDENGNKVVNIKFTATLVNRTSESISSKEMEKYKNDIINGIKQTYNGKMDDGTVVSVDVDVDILSKGEYSDPLSTRHEINIVDKLVNIGHTAESIIGGEYMNIRLDVCRGELQDDPMDRSAAHEFGHLLGLDHVSEGDNIMNEKNKGRVITGAQIQEACRNYNYGNMNCGIFMNEWRKKHRMPEWKAHK